MIWNRVWAIGRENYIRIYPNPGFGLRYRLNRRIAISWCGGIELFKKDPLFVWRRTKSYLSRVKRPGSV